MERMTNNVIQLEHYRFSVGTQAYHPHYQICKVVEVNGKSRVIEYLKVCETSSQQKRANVSVKELKAIKSLTHIHQLA